MGKLLTRPELVKLKARAAALSGALRAVQTELGALLDALGEGAEGGTEAAERLSAGVSRSRFLFDGERPVFPKKYGKAKRRG